jgi:hypothetical protein
MFRLPRLCKTRLSFIAGLALIAAFQFSSQLSAQKDASSTSPDRAHIEEILRSLNRGRSAGEVAVSPDGKRIAWTQGGREGGEMLVAPISDLGKSEHVTAAAKPDQHCREGQPIWQPDSAALAFFSDCGKPGEQTSTSRASTVAPPAASPN